MIMNLRPTRMEVSLDNIVYNYHAIENYVKPSKVIPVIKANAYGLGAVTIAWRLKMEGADFFAVATPDEALDLRDSGIQDPVLVLGPSPYNSADIYVKLGIRATITDILMAEELSKAAVRQGRQAYIHFKSDSGLGRIGFLPDETLSAAEKISKMPGINFEGISTHFATADTENSAHVETQFNAFSSVLESLKKAGISFGMVHCCNSGALLNGMSNMFCDAVRPGHILFGLNPSAECENNILIKPCFEIKTNVAAVRELPPNFGVSYGLTYTTTETERIAILPIGYADGYDRRLSNKGSVLINGKRCPVRGRVCMDQCIVGISHLEKEKENVSVGDEAVLLGSQGDEIITVSDLAEAMQSITGAVSVAFTARLPRVYI